jgi:hypothetical protein
MSLHTLANHLQTAGRGEDKVLVHMTPGEVQGLQSLAMAHGGSLTINPETGLPEAGFLSSILPMVAGAGLMMIPGMQPLAASMIVGAGGAVATGSLSKGLMMGLGAYGGAGLGAGLGLGSAGAGAASLAPQMSVAPQLGAMGSSVASTAPASYAALTNSAGALNAATPGLNAATNTALGGMSTFPSTAQSQATSSFLNAQQPLVSTPDAPAMSLAPQSAPSVMDRIKNIPSKVGEIFSGTGSEADKQRDELKKYLIASGVSAASLYQDDPEKLREEQALEADPNAVYGRGQYRASVRPGNTGERTYSFYADGGTVGQPVEQMSQQNSVGANTNYPMANIKPYGYAVPKNVPVSQNVFKPDGYQNLDPYTGEQKFAGGGLATLHFKSGGAFISKLKAVKEPKKATPKLTDTKALEKAIDDLKKYGSYDEQMDTYNTLTGKVKELQTEKINKAKELAERQKTFGAEIKKLQAAVSGKVKEVNTEYGTKIADFNKETAKEAGQKAKDIAAEFGSRQKQVNAIKNKSERAAAQKELANWKSGADRDLNTYKQDRASELGNINKEKTAALADVNKEITDYTTDFNNFKTEVTSFNKNADTEIGQANKDAVAAKKAADFAKQRETKETQFETISKANQTLIDKANTDYETATSNFNKYNTDLEEEKAKWEEQTKRQATGISSLRAQSTTPLKTSASAGNEAEIEAEIARLEGELSRSEGLYQGQHRQNIQKQIDDLKSGAATSGAAATSAGITTGYMKDPITGKLVPYQKEASFQKYTKAPGYDASTRIMDESDVKNLFQDVAGRSPTEEELDQYLGAKTTDAALAATIMKLPDVSGKTTFSDEDLADNFKYYIGRDPNKGELANLKKSNLTNFNALRNYLQAQPTYVDNINKIGTTIFNQAVKAQEKTALEEYRLNAPISADEVSTAYQDALGRKPNIDELKQYMNTNILPQELESQLKSSDEYLNSLTKPMVPDLKQQGAINVPSATQAPAAPPINFTSYAPNTALEFTPEALAASNAGSVSGLMATPTGMQMPQNRSPVTIEGALPLNPTGQEQLGLQTLYGQLATQAPSLQTGMSFAAPETSAYGLPSNPQSIEAALAAIAKQRQASQEAVQQDGMPTVVPGLAGGGMAGYNLGGYSDGGRLLRGPGDGVSDSIPATIGNRQPARLADGEFVIPARIVSELGNGSTDAGARKLYAMMQRIQHARGKTVGRNKVAVNSRAEKLLPA